MSIVSPFLAGLTLQREGVISLEETFCLNSLCSSLHAAKYGTDASENPLQTLKIAATFIYCGLFSRGIDKKVRGVYFVIASSHNS